MSFVLSCFHYTGKLNLFDQVIYWGNMVAELFAPTIFLHFCLTFPEARGWLRNRYARALLYLPATLLFAVSAAIVLGNLQVAISPIDLRWLVDRVQLAFLVTWYLLGAAALALEYRRTEDPILRQQMKWLRNGAVLGIVPFAVFYALPHLAGVAPTSAMQFALFP